MLKDGSVRGPRTPVEANEIGILAGLVEEAVDSQSVDVGLIVE
jgi:hypothetical protein